MADNGAQGTTLSFGGAIADVQSVSLSINGNPVSISDLSDTIDLWLVGLIDYELSVEVLGVGTFDVGDTGTISVAFNDGTTETGAGATFVVTAATKAATKGGTVTNSVTIKPNTAAG